MHFFESYKHGLLQVELNVDEGRIASHVVESFAGCLVRLRKPLLGAVGKPTPGGVEPCYVLLLNPKAANNRRENQHINCARGERITSHEKH